RVQLQRKAASRRKTFRRHVHGPVDCERVRRRKDKPEFFALLRSVEKWHSMAHSVQAGGHISAAVVGSSVQRCASGVARVCRILLFQQLVDNTLAAAAARWWHGFG